MDLNFTSADSRWSSGTLSGCDDKAACFVLGNVSMEIHGDLGGFGFGLIWRDEAGGEVLALWYAFLISALLAPFVMFRTSNLDVSRWRVVL